MIIPSVILFAYLLAHAALAFGGGKARNKDARRGPDEFDLAGRSLSGPLLLATLAASNLSAFTVFGVSGAAYRLGWAFFPAMCFGTALMAASFAYVGVPQRRLAAESGWSTPGRFVAGRLGSPALGTSFSILSLIYTVPYLAVQAGSGGRLIASMSGIPASACSAILVGLIVAYVMRGGMAGVARGDAMQLAVLVILTLAAAGLAVWKAQGMGILSRAFQGPAVERASADGSLGLLTLVGYYALWSLADPMFPHLAQRFMAAKTDKALYASMTAYPLVALAVFLPVCLIGVIGSVMIPGLPPGRSDAIFNLLAVRLAGPVIGPLFSIAALAALISTMDSQLLSCASILSTDLMASKRGRASRFAIPALAIGAWLVSLRPPDSILAFLNRTAFPGYASLMPVVLAAIYAPGLGRSGPAAALAMGTALVISEAAGVLVPPIPAALFNLAAQAMAFAIAALLERWIKSGMRREMVAGLGFGYANRPSKWKAPSGNRVGLRRGSAWPYAAAVAIAATLGLDVWNFVGGASASGAWIAYHAAATLALAAAYAAYGRAAERRAKASKL